MGLNMICEPCKNENHENCMDENVCMCAFRQHDYKPREIYVPKFVIPSG